MKEENTFNIVAIDPGTMFTGIACLCVDVSTCEIIGVSAHTLNALKLDTFYKDEVELHGERFVRIKALCLKLREYLYKVDPLFVAIEKPYYNPRRPNAYGTLVELLSSITHTVYEWDKYRCAEFIDAASVKKAIGVSGKSGDKDLMKQALKQYQWVDKSELESLDQHSIDAIAIAYTSYMRYFHHPRSQI